MVSHHTALIYTMVLVSAADGDMTDAELVEARKVLEKIHGNMRFWWTDQTAVEQALASGSPGNNPRVPSADEITKLYEEVWA